jgi:tRNA-Thr(GGU) m(6)t(6)A37 methyltransferase TsaA
VAIAEPPRYEFSPIGWVRSPLQRRAEAPHQPSIVPPGASVPADARIVLADHIPATTLRGLDGFDRLWVLYVLDRSEGWRALVVPPRGPHVRRGVFATRAPHRPNPIGLSAVALIGVEGREILVRGVDMLDGTPVLDVKPYVAFADAFPDARAGWVDALQKSGATPQLRKRSKQE